MVVDKNLNVLVTYSLIAGEAEGDAEVMEQASIDHPFSFICGLGTVLPKFEENLIGKAEDEEFNFVLAPEDAYGEYDDNRVLELDINIFKDEKGVLAADLIVDHTLPMMDNEGNQMLGTVLEISDKKVKMDFNHPLAGETLHFVGKVIAVREATAEEMAAATNVCGGGCGGGCHGGCHSEGGCQGDGTCGREGCQCGQDSAEGEGSSCECTKDGGTCECGQEGHSDCGCGCNK